MRRYESAAPVVMTIGHSTRSLQEFIHLLKSNGVKRLVDVRSVPSSRHNPQFNRTALSPTLHSARLHYKYMPGLGGFRHPRPDSINTAWRNPSFRGYADYMQTPEFEESLVELIDTGEAGANGDNVRRGRSMAMSPVPDRRCAIGGRHCRPRNHRSRSHETPYAYALGAAQRDACNLPWSRRS